MKGRASPAARALAALALAVLAPACALVLGVQNDPTVASTAICGCDALSTVNDCASSLEARLEGATPADRSAWLQNFATNCASSCQTMVACFYDPPACVAKGNVCTNPLECCSYHTGDLVACQGIVSGHGTCR